MKSGASSESLSRWKGSRTGISFCCSLRCMSRVLDQSGAFKTPILPTCHASGTGSRLIYYTIFKLKCLLSHLLVRVLNVFWEQTSYHIYIYVSICKLCYHPFHRLFSHFFLCSLMYRESFLWVQLFFFLASFILAADSVSIKFK